VNNRRIVAHSSFQEHDVNVLILTIAFAASSSGAKNVTLRPVWTIPLGKRGGSVLETPKGPVVWGMVGHNMDSETYLLNPSNGRRVWERKESPDYSSTSLMYSVGQSVVVVGADKTIQAFIPNRIYLLDLATGKTWAQQGIGSYFGFDFKPGIVDGNAFFLVPSNKKVKQSRLWWVDPANRQISEVKSFADGSRETNPRLIKLLANRTVGFSRRVYHFDAQMHPHRVELDTKDLGIAKSANLVEDKYVLTSYNGMREFGHEDEPAPVLADYDSARALFRISKDGKAVRQWSSKSELKYPPGHHDLRHATRTNPPLGTLTGMVGANNHLYGLTNTYRANHQWPVRSLIEFDTKGHILTQHAAKELNTDGSGHAWILDQPIGFPLTESRLVLHPLEDVNSSVTLETKLGTTVFSLSISADRREFTLVDSDGLSLYRR